MSALGSNFTRNFKRLFGEGKWSQNRLSETSGVSSGLIHGYLNGKVPTIENLEKIAAALDISPITLLAEDAPAPTQNPRIARLAAEIAKVSPEYLAQIEATVDNLVKLTELEAEDPGERGEAESG